MTRPLVVGRPTSSPNLANSAAQHDASESISARVASMPLPASTTTARPAVAIHFSISLPTMYKIYNQIELSLWAYLIYQQLTSNPIKLIKILNFKDF